MVIGGNNENVRIDEFSLKRYALLIGVVLRTCGTKNGISSDGRNSTSIEPIPDPLPRKNL